MSALAPTGRNARTSAAVATALPSTILTVAGAAPAVQATAHRMPRPAGIFGRPPTLQSESGRASGAARPGREVRHAGTVEAGDGRCARGERFPISAISDWYGYSRQNGVRMSAHYPAGLSNTVTDLGRRAACAASRTAMSAADGDDTGDRNPFWDERNYLAHVDDVQAAVFATHGLQDDNVKLDQLAQWWAGLTANDVPRKLWLLRAGHVDPFDSRRAVWVSTLHRWLDHWLLGVDNGVMGEPQVDIEDAANVWNTPSASLSAPTDGMFRAGSSTLPRGGTALLRALRDAVGDARRITCTGHTDDRGAAAANVRLGLARARAVCAFLVADTDVATRATSRGEAAPRASNRTAAGRAANRRVTIAIEL